MKKLHSLILAALCVAAFTGCKTTQVVTNPDGSVTTNRVVDVAKTEQVKDAAEAITGMAFRRILGQFPTEAETISKYAAAAGNVLCEMNRTQQFDPFVLEAGLSRIVLPRIQDEDARLWVLDARDAIVMVYKSFYRQRFTAELPANEWPGAVAEVLCNSIDRALIDSGRTGVKQPLPATADVERARAAVHEAINRVE